VQINDLDHDRLRRLAGFRTHNGHRVLSLYLDLDPADFGTVPARASQVSSLLDEADRRTRDTALDHAARRALCVDIGRAREFLRGDFAKGAHALALFASGPDDLFEVLRLPEAVPHAVAVSDAPWLDPLIGREGTRRCVALVNRRTLRLFADAPGDGGMREVEQLADDVHRKHDQGGWSQANYERSIEDDVRKHVERSARALFEQHRREPYDALAIGCPAELWAAVEHALHPYVRERCLGRFEVDVEHVGTDQAVAAASELFEAAERRRLDELLSRVAAGVATGGRAADGLVGVLDALNERRVEALLYEAGFSRPGFACPRSGWLGVDAAACPSGEENAEPRENVLEDAIAAAILQSAAVHCLRDRPELGPLGGIAALLRF
jgi:peptide chain release factor subunit 1